MDWDMWGPPLVVLGVSSVVAFGIVAMMKGEEQEAGTQQADARRAELEAKKDQLMEALRELDADRSKLSEDSYTAQRESLLSEASQVMAALDGKMDTTVEPKAPMQVSSQAWMYVLGTLAFFGLLGKLIVDYSAPRQEGGVMTGGEMPSQSEAELMKQFEEWGKQREVRQATAKDAIAKNPKDIDALNVLTYDALLMRDMQSAMTYMEQVRNVDPKDPDFMVHLAILQMSVGMTDRSEIGFAQALQARPNMQKALLWKGYMLSATEQKTEALKILQSIEGEFSIPEEKYFYDGLIADLNKPPALISGIVDAQGDLPKGTLFVIARRSPAGGMPVAVQKVPNPAFPMKFELGPTDMMMGGEWPEQVYLEIRLDLDGNAMTKADGDVNSEVQGPLPKDSHDLSVTLIAPEKSETPEPEASDVKLSGTITAEGDLPKGTLFIIARRSPSGGMPAAVKKIDSPTFPFEFTLGPVDMMMGGEWPEQVWLDVRLDEDGNAISKSDNDVNAEMQGPLTGVQTGVQVTLKK